MTPGRRTDLVRVFDLKDDSDISFCLWWEASSSISPAGMKHLNPLTKDAVNTGIWAKILCHRNT